MQTEKLIAELGRLYLPAGSAPPHALAGHVMGKETIAVTLATADGRVRAIVIPFTKTTGSEEARHWTRLCAVANELQAGLGFPAPAVSISGADGYGLWLSLETPVPVAEARKFLGLLRQAYFPDVELHLEAVGEPVALPPCVNQQTGKWAAFIHPGMGASFADEAGLEMAPPLAGQVAFLEGLQSISAKQFRHAMDVLGHASAPAPATAAAADERPANADTLLLKDASLEDIIAFLHAKNIEPTFRHLVPQA